MPNKGATMPYMFGRVTVEDYETFCDVFDDAKNCGILRDRQGTHFISQPTIQTT